MKGFKEAQKTYENMEDPTFNDEFCIECGEDLDENSYCEDCEIDYSEVI